MKNISFKKHKIEWILVILSIIALIFYTLRFTTIFDEDYTLVLIHNSFPNIIKFDSLDVHPPLYYFLLKIFLGITTFWTNSFLTKILFARIFSVIISIITFIFLFKISKELGIKNNILVQWLLFLLVPGVISFTYEFIKIRMYSLGALFVVVQFYELLEYKQRRNKFNLFFITVSFILSLYTNYYSGFISGLILFICIINDIFQRKNKAKLLLSGVVSLFCFLLWLPVLLKQMSFQANHPISGFLKQWVASFVIILFFIYPLILFYKKHINSILVFFFSISFFTVLLLFCVMTIISLVFKPVFEFRYLYPALLPYCFISLNIYWELFKDNIDRKYVCVSIFTLCILLCGGAYISQIRYYNLSSGQIFNDFYKWKVDKESVVHLKFINNDDEGFDMEKLIYLSNIGKYVVVPKNDILLKYPNNIKMTESNLAYHKLFKKINNHVVN